ncbi:MAG: cytochrome c oxidase assembly protein [Solirubrobacteraceae bacterium]
MPPPVQWSFEPTVFAGVALLSVAYGWLWRRARAPRVPHPPGYGQLALFAASMACVVLALVSPLDSISDNVMAVHMVQHMLLLDVIPVLLILSLSKTLLRPVTRRIIMLEQRTGLLATPAFAVFAYVVVVCSWHVPALYDLAIAHSGVHALEHLCFSAVGLLFWWHLISPVRGRKRLSGLQVIFYIGTAKLFIGTLGILLTFEPRCIYPWYIAQPHYWGLSPRADQNLAGAVMALEQSIVTGIALAYLVIKALGDSERDAQREEQYGGAMASYRTALAATRKRQQTEQSR